MALAGTSIEWYDFFLYATAAALVFPLLFFPPDMSPVVALLASFSTFAVGFVARPLGGVLFGHFGDRLGRKKALVVALVLMGVSTTLIGCLPVYSTAGLLAPIALIICRFLQGIAIGGQWGAAVLIVTETAPRQNRGFYGAFAQAGAPVGVILSNLTFLAVSGSMDDAAFLEWGWRVPFLASVLLVFLAVYGQLRLEDTPAFKNVTAMKQQQEAAAIAKIASQLGIGVEQATAMYKAQKTPSPVFEAIRTYYKQILLIAAAVISVQITFYILIAFVIAYGTHEIGLQIPRDEMLMAVLVGAVAMIPGIFISAWLSDRYERRQLVVAGAALLALWSFALFPLMQTREFIWIATAIGVGQICVSLMYGPQAAFVAEMFEARVRYSAASLGYQLSAIIGGGFAPLIATTLLTRFGSALPISIFIAIGCAITIGAVLRLEDRRGVEL